MNESAPGVEEPRPEDIHEAGYETSLEEIDPSALEPSIQSFAPYQERQGLYIHSFKCEACSLEFAIFSWWPDRHTVVNTACPECHRITPKAHWMSTVSDDRAQQFGDGPEIFNYSPAGTDPKLMSDSSLFTGLPEEDPVDGWPRVT